MKSNTHTDEDLDALIWNKDSFPNKTCDDEDIFLLVREDILILIFRAIGLYLAFFFLLFLRLLITSYLDLFWIAFYDAVMYAIGAILTVIFAVDFHNYYLSLQIVTSERIIDIDQPSLFRREVNTTLIENIQDVTYKKDTFIKTFFNYGDVIVQTAGNAANEENSINGFIFKNVPSPKEVADLLNQVHDQKINHEYREKAKHQAKELQELLSGKILGS